MKDSHRQTALRISVLYVLFGTAWILLSDELLPQISDSQATLVWLSIAKGLAFIAVTGSLLYVVLARAGGAAPSVATAPPQGTPGQRIWGRRPVLVFVLLALLLLAGMVALLRHTAMRTVDDAYNQLEAIGGLKARQIEMWLQQRAAAASTARGLIAPRRAALELMRGVSSTDGDSLQHRLEAYVAELQLETAAVLDATGKVLAHAGASLSLDKVSAQRVREVARRDLAMPQVLHRQEGPAGTVYLDYLLPWQEPGGQTVFAVLMLRHRADRFLYPLVQSWPTRSPSAETLLVRREGGSVLFLNEPRHRAGAALALRADPADEFLAAAQALRGEQRPMRSVDYRGVDVIALGRPISGTDWLLIAKIDMDEALEPVRTQGLLFSVLILGVTLLAGVGTMLMWRQQESLAALHQRGLLAERDALGEHLRLLSRHAHDIVLLLDASGRIVRANDRALQAYGRATLEGVHANELRSRAHATQFEAALAGVLREGSGLLETTHRHADGTEFPVEISAHRIDTDGGVFVQTIIRDVTERRRAEQDLGQSETRFRAMVEQSISGIYVIQDGRFAYVNPRMAEIFGYAFATDVIGRAPEELVAPPDRATVRANIERRISGQARALAYTFRGLRKDGSEIEVGVHGSAATFGGRPAVIGALQDISERSRLENERHVRLARLEAQLAAVSRISASPTLIAGDLEALAREVTAAAAGAAGVERASVWLFNSHETELRCLDLYEATPARHSSGAVLTEAQYREEFRALKDARYVDTDDPLTDPRTAGYADGYLRPLRITSMLDAVVRVGDRLIGLLCLEHVDRAHRWERDELAFACALADQLALVHIQRERRQALDGLDAVASRLRKVNRALRTLSAGNETLVRAGDEPTLLREMCSVIVQSGGYRFAAVGYVQPGEGRPIAPQASAGIPFEELCDIPMPRADPGHRLAPSASAIAKGAPQLHLDPASDPQFAPWRDLIVRHELASAVSMPLRASAHSPPYGVLVIGASDRDAFDSEAIKLLEELANDLAFGIGNLRLREDQRTSAAALRKSLEDTILAIAATTEMRDPYTAGHERRVAELAACIAREMGFAEPAIEGIRFGAMIHDLGKIKIPAEILVKPTRLTPIEYEFIKQHAQAGFDILKGIDFPWPVAQIVLQHHERIDGSGYPQGLKGDAIIREARILAVADTVEAMSSHRPYRPGLGLDKALAEIERGRGTLYDPAVVDACLRLFREKAYTLAA